MKKEKTARTLGWVILILLMIVLSHLVSNSYGFINNNTKYMLFDAEKVESILGISDTTEIMVVYLPENVSYNIFTKTHLDGTICPSIDGKFVLFISPHLNEDMAAEVFMHEMSHIKQVISGDLQYIRHDSIVWKGQHYTKYRHNSLWESQARLTMDYVKSQLKCKNK
jgi:hypothetical protein